MPAICATFLSMTHLIRRSLMMHPAGAYTLSRRSLLGQVLNEMVVMIVVSCFASLCVIVSRRNAAQVVFLRIGCGHNTPIQAPLRLEFPHQRLLNHIVTLVEIRSDRAHRHHARALPTLTA